MDYRRISALIGILFGAGLFLAAMPEAVAQESPVKPFPGINFNHGEGIIKGAAGAAEGPRSSLNEGTINSARIPNIFNMIGGEAGAAPSPLMQEDLSPSEQAATDEGSDFPLETAHGSPQTAAVRTQAAFRQVGESDLEKSREAASRVFDKAAEHLPAEPLVDPVIGKNGEESHLLKTPANRGLSPSGASLPPPRRNFDGIAGKSTIAGFAFLGGAVWISSWLAAPLGLMAWIGLAMLGLGKFLRSPRGPAENIADGAPAAIGAEPRPATPPKGRFRTFEALWSTAQRSLRLHERAEEAVGGASWNAFRRWFSSGLRAALYLFPFSLLGMLAGSLLQTPLKWLWPAAAKTAVISDGKIAAIPLWNIINGTVLHQVAQEILFLGLGFKVLLWLSRRWRGASSSASITAVALALAFYIPMVVAMGFPLGLAITLAGIEAALLYAYARSGTLLIPVAMRAAIALMGADSARFISSLKAAVSGTLVGMPEWGYLAVAGAALAIFTALSARALWARSGWSFLREGAKRELARLKGIGQWWSAPTADGAPKSSLPLLSLGLFWAIPTYLLMGGVFTAVHRVLPQTEPTPEILRRMLLAPVDVLIYNFMIVAALEEWIFRRGVFKAIQERLEKWKPSRRWFLPAAIASSLIFSGAHYIDWNAMLLRLGLGNAELGSALAGAYAFTWASFLARAAGGMILAFLYASSGVLLVPMIAHFGSNFLESLGMRWGLAASLSAAAALVTLHLIAARPRKS